MLIFEAEARELAGKDDDDVDDSDPDSTPGQEKETFPFVVAGKYPLQFVLESKYDSEGLHMQREAIWQEMQWETGNQLEHM